jgi:hypothetical protein
MNFKPVAMIIRMFGTKPMHEKNNLNALLDALEQFPKCVPEYWSLDERSKLPFSRADICEQAVLRQVGRTISVYLRRNKVSKYFGHFDMSYKPYISFEFNPALAERDWPLFFEFADALVQAFKPDIATVYISPSYADAPWPSDEDRYLNLIVRSANIIPVKYYKEGPRGLAMRTYFGPHYIEQFGRELLLSTPGVAIDEQQWGGLRLDLAKAPWALSVPDMIDQWKLAMAHLTPAQVFADVEITPKQRINYTKGSRCITGGIINE